MQTQADMLVMDTFDEIQATVDGPSEDFIHKISQLLDTDPSDILTELGYFCRDEAHQAE